MAQTEVTNKLLQNNSVTGEKIINGSISTKHFENGSVTNNKLSPTDNVKFLIGDTSKMIKTYVTFNNSTGVATISANFLTVTYGNGTNIGFTSGIGLWDINGNSFDIFPPEGKTMQNFVNGLVTIRSITWAGTVNDDDSIRCAWNLYNGNTWTDDKNNSDRVRFHTQNSEQRSAATANFIIFWD